MEQYKKYIRNKRYHRNYTHSVLYPGATFRTKSDGECSIPDTVQLCRLTQLRKWFSSQAAFLYNF